MGQRHEGSARVLCTHAMRLHIARNWPIQKWVEGRPVCGAVSVCGMYSYGWSGSGWIGWVDAGTRMVGWAMPDWHRGVALADCGLRLGGSMGRSACTVHDCDF